MTLGSFDFSSVSEWEAFYATDDEDAVEEWHSSVPLELVVDYCMGAVGGDKDDAVDDCQKILMVGCGTSRLPETIWKRSNNKNGAAQITLLDSSPTCIQELKQRYGSAANYICGDALQLSTIDDAPFDTVVDKGLMDALLCGEGWNGPVQKLLKEASTVLRPGEGRYVLVSYRLPSSTQDFLAKVGRDYDLDWKFDCEGSNDRVGISIAIRKTNN